MTKAQYKEYQRKANTGELQDELNPIFAFSNMNSALLAELATGKINIQDLIKLELANRGLDINGTWVGFDKAAKLHNIK